jgi:hypothetical protein
MNEVTLIGIDLGKHVFHLHVQDAKGHEVFRKKLSRAQLSGATEVIADTMTCSRSQYRK